MSDYIWSHHHDYGFVEYTDEDCGRERVYMTMCGKHRCEKCGWVVEDQEYVILD